MTKYTQEEIIKDLPLIHGVVMTDKSTTLLRENKYTFFVAKESTKPRIKRVIEYLFDAKVKKINLYYKPIKMGRVGMHYVPKPRSKKAIVTVHKGSSIDYYREINE